MKIFKNLFGNNDKINAEVVATNIEYDDTGKILSYDTLNQTIDEINDKLIFDTEVIEVEEEE